MARFKAEEQSGAVGEAARQIIDEEKEKKAARLARFGEGNPESEKQKRGSLEFTLDEYKSKQKPSGDFLKKRHHSNKSHSHQKSGGQKGQHGHQQQNQQHGGGGGGGKFHKKRFNKGGQHQGPPQQGSNKFKGNSFKRAKHY